MGKLISAHFPLNPQIETLDSFVNINDILTDTLLGEILQRLPCAHVLRAKTVCKRWHFVIAETHFVSTFIRYHDKISLTGNTRHSLPVTLVYQFIFWHRVLTEEPESRVHSISDHQIFQTREFNLGFLPCFRRQGPHPIWVVASSKDLLVCCDTKMSLQSSYYICNPLTKQWVTVPPIMSHHRVADTAMGLIVSPKGNFRLVQVLELASEQTNNRFEAEVFCSEIGEWTKFIVSCPRSFTRSWQFKPNAIAVNKKLHWLVNSESIVVLDTFEGDSGLCCVIDLPSKMNSQATVCLGSCQERLKMCQITGGYPNGKLVAWELRDYDTEKWELEWEICVKDMGFVDNLCFRDFGFSNVEVLAFHPSDKGILYLRIRNKLVMCNLGCRMLEVVSECLEDSTSSIGTCGVFPLMHPSWPSSLIPSQT